MKDPIVDNEVLKESLRRAYLGKEDIEVGERWRRGTMSRIRAIGSMRKADFWMGLEQLAWRLSPVTCGLIILCALAFLGLDSFHDYEILSVFTSDPGEPTLSQLIGFGA